MAKVKVKKTAGKTASKKAPAAKRASAASKGVNKSKAIRDYLAQHPNEGPNAVAAALRKSGVDVTPAFVSTVKSMDRKRTGSETVEPVTRSGSASRVDRAANELAADDLLRAKELAVELGGVARARAALDVLARIVG